MMTSARRRSAARDPRRSNAASPLEGVANPSGRFRSELRADPDAIFMSLDADVSGYQSFFESFVISSIFALPVSAALIRPEILTSLRSPSPILTGAAAL